MIQTLAQRPPTVRQMLSLWLPLAASIVMMVLEPSIINMGLGRTADPELALAAFGVAFSLALLIEAPIITLLDASVARSANRATFALLRRFTLLLGIAVTSTGLIVSLSPLYSLIVEGLMNTPSDVAARARTTLQVLSFWPLPIAWRRAHQGVLIRTERTAIITVATAVRLSVLAGALVGGLLFWPTRGALVAGMAMVLSVVTEAGLVTIATRPVLRSYPSGETELTMRELWRFYRPLLTSSVVRQTTRPALNAGIAAAAMARASLAAWPVVWGFAILVGGPAWSLQQLTTALGRDETAYRQLRRFALALSAFFALLLALVAFTPLYGLVMGGVYNLSPTLQELGRPSLRLMVAYPLFMGAQALLRGMLIRKGCTASVSSAMVASVLSLLATLAVGVWAFKPVGATLAAAATLVGGLVDWIWLRWRTHCEAVALRPLRAAR